ncbi:MAG TPA: cache domain-containing protein [Lentimicrobium sp.]|nr:cache domain-containing protein [Lentimicrobium sp.]
MMSIALMLILVVGHYWASYENKKYRTEYNQVKKELVEYQKELVKREVIRTLNYVTYMRSLSQERMMNSLTNRVNTAWNIANSLYKNNRGQMSDDQIKKLIKDALRVYNTGDSEDYIFIFGLDGTSVLQPRNPQREGLSALQIKDSLGNYMVKREVELMKEVDKGFITYYTHSKTDPSDSAIYRYSYLKKFAPFGWYFGSKEYLSDFEKTLKEDVLNRVSKIRFDSEGYIFIQGFDNEPIMTNGYIINDNKAKFSMVDVSERQKVSDLAKKGGGFIEYKINRNSVYGKELKIAYVHPITEWNWIVGAGFYTKDVDQIIKAKGDEIARQKSKTITIISLALFAILLIGYILTKLLINKIKKGFNKFTKFFVAASSDYRLIDVQELSSPEFISLGRSANKMLTDLEATRNALEKEHSLLRSVMNSIPDMVFFKDTVGKYIGCNEAFAKYIGISEEELIGKTDHELFSKEAADFYYNNDKKILSDGQPLRNEEWSTLPNGKKCLFETLKVLCHDSSGNIQGIICISRDMTEREIIQKKYIEAKEKAEESDRLKTAFLANMSHEIRTPMNSIVGFSNLIAEGGLSKEEQTEYVGHIDTAINNLLNIINDIIDIAKIEAGQLSIKPEYVDLANLMEEQYLSAQEYRKRLMKDKIKIKYSIDSQLYGNKLLVDPYRLTQVLTNLINNAIKFTNVGEIVFGSELRDGNVFFYVKDTGIGISEEEQQVIFKRFRQVGEGATSHKMGGTGLGLAISKHIVELMNGNINVYSEKGNGSYFTFEIPYYPHQTETESVHDLVKKDWKDKVILIIEGDDLSFNYVKAVFATTKAKIMRAQNLKDASAICNDTKIDLIYAEMDNSGNQLEEFLGEIKKNNVNIPIVAQIGALSTSVNNFTYDVIIEKPVKYHLLLKSIAPYLNN